MYVYEQSNPRQLESDHFPEVASEGSAWRRIEQLGMLEALDNPSDRRDLFADFGNEDFKKMLGYINSVTQKKKISYEYKDGTLPALETPTMEEKEPLMNETFDAMRDILRRGEYTDSEALRRASLTLAGAINLVHPYANGNGRTGRVAHYLIEYGTDRGDRAFGDELFAIISKGPVYTTDPVGRIALYNAPPTKMIEELYDVAAERIESFNEQSPREQAASKVRCFLGIMRGEFKHQMSERRASIRGEYDPQTNSFVGGSIDTSQFDIPDFYEYHYIDASEIANRGPEDIPENAERILGRRKQKLVA